MKASVSKLCEEVQEHEQLRRRLADIEEQLQRSLESNTAANKKASGEMVELKTALENMQKIARERSSIEKELKLKERECELLLELKKKDELFFEKKIIKKKKKIKTLRTELQTKEHELESAQQEARMQQAELLKAQAEVKKKHEEVKRLQREREELACSYNIENLQVSKRIQITVITASDQEEMKVIIF